MAIQIKRGRLLCHFSSPVAFSLCVAALLVLFFNFRFWQETVATFWSGAPMDALFLLALLAVQWLGCAAILLLVPGNIPLQVASALLFPLAAMAAYCADSFGLPIDQTMIRSFFASNRQEALGVVSPRLVGYAIVLGVLPIVLIGRSRLAPVGWKTQVRQRVAFLAASGAVAAAAVLAFPSQFRALGAEHRYLAYLIVPGAALDGVLRFAHASLRSAVRDASAANVGPPRRVDRPDGAKPLLVLLVVGETARHANFQLGGYGRPTNPRLSGLADLHYFGNVQACSTATVISLPCMFSPLGREGFSLALAHRFPTALDVLLDAGIRVAWHSNNAGRQDVSPRVPTTDATRDAPAHLCSEESCFDEVLLRSLEKELGAEQNPQQRHGPERAGPGGASGDALIVLHQLGSHGPAYFQRVPPAWRRFLPACDTNEPKRCDPASLVNAYDNTILYTDHLLAEKIGMLGRIGDRFDTALFFVSDHGESLGENGRYLHGMPYAVAPEEQKRIPMIAWMSPGYAERFGVDQACLRARATEALSHDHLYHTLLGAMAVRNERYQPRLDVMAPCRRLIP